MLPKAQARDKSACLWLMGSWAMSLDLAAAILAYLTSEFGNAAKRDLRNMIVGDTQQRAMRRVVEHAVRSTVDDLSIGLNADVLSDVFLRELPGEPVSVPVAQDLRGAVLIWIEPRLEVLAEQGYQFDAGRIAEMLLKHIASGVE